MTYNLILIAIVIISVIIGTALGKNGPKWKAPLIVVCVFVVALVFLNFLGLSESAGN